ncbi:MAG: DUF4350 domain-containing protein [Bacteroidia bacterium]|nr:DUF4350 domain-containing protein [Bacteroidia bacterium]
MDKKSVPIIVFIAVIIISIAAFIFIRSNISPKYNWNENYSRNSEQPYGLKLFYTVLKQQEFPLTILYNRNYHLLDTNRSNGNLIYIGFEYQPDSADIKRMMKFVEKGNRVFIASDYVPIKILVEFVPQGDSIYGCKTIRDSIVYLTYANNDLPFPARERFNYQNGKDTVATYWAVYNNSYFKRLHNDFNFQALSFLNDTNICAFYINHGKGRFYFHTTPVFFTNYYLAQQKGYTHAANMLSLMRNGPVYWDEPDSYKPGTDSDSPGKSPLKFLFSHPYLRWAWYLLLFTIFLYLVFRSKREQRIIPLMPLNVNTTIEYVKAIGTLYFKSSEQRYIANEMYIVFLSDIRGRYNLATNVPESELVDQLAIRSGINKRIIENLFKKFKRLRSESSADGDDLVDLYNAIENYNKKRK